MGEKKMKVKEYALSIILNAFLGYVFVLFIFHIIEVSNSMDHVLVVGGMIIILGCTLFFEVMRRVSPFNEYKKTHPLNIVGSTSFIGMTAVIYFFNWM
jgi:phage-related holin